MSPKQSQILGTILIFVGIFLLMIGLGSCVSALCVKEGHSGRLKYDIWTKAIKCEEDL